MIRVCLVAPLPPPYGGISHWTRMVRNRAQNSTEISVQVVDTATRWREVHELSSLRRIIGGSLQLVRNVWRLIRLVVRWRPHVIHLVTSGQFGLFRDIAVLLIARIFRIRSIYHIRFGRVPQILSDKNSIENWLFHVATRLAAHTVTIDSATYESMKSRREFGAVSLIPNCYDPNAIQVPSESPEKIITFIGWILPTKGVEDLLAGWERIDHSGWSLNLIGPGDRTYIAHLQSKFSNSDVVFAGELSHSKAMDVLARSCIFILPSYTEGFPNVVLEAMAHGKAIIASNVGAIPEMLSEGSGIVVSKGNVEELAHAMAELMANSKKRATLGSNARKRAQALYSLPAVFEKYVELWIRSTKY